ncbi:MAG TPA: GGDEF domain-containing protein [Gammaproteobacteria bacterium]|nr:GGDEF domain-containing protein [Gammaproteobacteria bacterium]
MNLSVLPDLLAIGGLVAVFVLLLRRTHQTRLRFWAFGWIFVLIHFIAELRPAGAGAITEAGDAIAIAALLSSSVAFLWAGGSMPTSRARETLAGILGAVPDIIFCVVIAYSVTWVPLYAALTVIGGGAALPLYCRRRREYESRRYARAGFIVVAYGLQLALVLTDQLDAALIWLLCWHFLAAAVAFRAGAAKRSIGVVFTTLSFVAWALVFPVAMMLSIWLPDVHVAPGVWNLPKYLVATGLLVTLLEEQMFKFEHAALHDALTNIPNRRMLLDGLDKAAGKAARGHPFALMILDLDLFKEINDRLGHMLGDRLLQMVASRLRGIVRQNDTLARIGGDEFAILLPDIDEHPAARVVVDKLEEALRQPFVIENTEYRIGASIGYALSPADGIDTAGLYALADQRMYDAKQAGRKIPKAI